MKLDNLVEKITEMGDVDKYNRARLEALEIIKGVEGNFDELQERINTLSAENVKLAMRIGGEPDKPEKTPEEIAAEEQAKNLAELSEYIKGAM